MSRDNYLKPVGVALIPIVIGGLIGWGVIKGDIESFKKQQQTNTKTLETVVVLDTTVGFLKDNIEALSISNATLQEQVNALTTNDAVKVEMLANLTRAIDELNGNLETSRDISQENDQYVKEEIIRLDERVKDLEK